MADRPERWTYQESRSCFGWGWLDMIPSWAFAVGLHTWLHGICGASTDTKKRFVLDRINGCNGAVCDVHDSPDDSLIDSLMLNSSIMLDRFLHNSLVMTEELSPNSTQKISGNYIFANHLVWQTTIFRLDTRRPILRRRSSVTDKALAVPSKR